MKFISFALLCASLFRSELSLAETTFSKISQLQLMGKVENARYVGYRDLFSVAVPDYAPPRYVEDDYFENKQGGVAFYNESGYFFKIEIDELLPEVKSIISKHSHIKDEVLDAMFHEGILPQLIKETPLLKLLDEKKIVLKNQEPALYVVLDLPESASVLDTASGRRLDCKRGYLLTFVNNTQLISFCMQDPYSLLPRFAHSAKLNLSQRLLNHLLELQSTFRVHP